MQPRCSTFQSSSYFLNSHQSPISDDLLSFSLAQRRMYGPDSNQDSAAYQGPESRCESFAAKVRMTFASLKLRVANFHSRSCVPQGSSRFPVAVSCVVQLALMMHANTIPNLDRR
jgi:hypothetical protein